MPSQEITLALLEAQERRFAEAFAANDLEIARPLYRPDVVYVSPTIRLFDRPRRIEGVDQALEFIALTVRGCESIRYRAIDCAITPASDGAFVHVDFEWTDRQGMRMQSLYVVLYRYRDGLIAEQRIYYDPTSGAWKVGEEP